MAYQAYVESEGFDQMPGKGLTTDPPKRSALFLRFSASWGSRFSVGAVRLFEVVPKRAALALSFSISCVGRNGYMNGRVEKSDVPRQKSELAYFLA